MSYTYRPNQIIIKKLKLSIRLNITRLKLKKVNVGNVYFYIEQIRILKMYLIIW